MSQPRSTARDIYYFLVSKLADEYQQVSVDGHSAAFLADDPEEYKEFYRFQSTNSEIHVIRELISAVEPGDRFIDIGSKVGLYTCLVGVSNPDSTLVAFEPHPENATRIRQNASVNGLDVTVHEAALSDHDGHATLFVQEESPGTGTHSVKRGGQNSIQVPAARLDSLVSKDEVPVPDVVKIDVEGAEADVIDGMTGLFERSLPRTLVVEVHESILQDPTGLEQRLRTNGYELSILGERGSEYHLRADISE